MLGSEELCILCGETYPGIPGWWVTVVMPEPLDSVTLGIVLCVCNTCMGAVPSFHVGDEIPVYLAGEEL